MCTNVPTPVVTSLVDKGMPARAQSAGFVWVWQVKPLNIQHNKIPPLNVIFMLPLTAASVNILLARYLDGAPATLDVLATIVSSIDDEDFPVFLDGGILAGMDVFKAIALGK